MDIEILLILQDFRNGIGRYLASFLAKMTFLGELNSVLVIMAVIYWSVSKELGSYLLMGWSGNRLVNGFLKVTFCSYRPWIRDERIIPYGDSKTTATGYSFPSGHTMNAATVYGGGALRKDMPAPLRYTLGFLILMIAFSRIYLGVHTPQDVLVGAGAGMLVMWGTLKLTEWLRSNPKKDWIVVCVGVALAVAVSAYAGIKPYPEDFDAEGKLIVDGAKMALDTFKGAGWCLAFLVGWILERRYVGFTTDVPFEAKLMRGTIGLLSYYMVSLILVPLIKAAIPEPFGTLISCFIQMFYVSFIFPWMVVHIEKPILPESEQES